MPCLNVNTSFYLSSYYTQLVKRILVKMPSNNGFTVSWVCTSDLELFFAVAALDETYHTLSNTVQYSLPIQMATF
jgi:hypothetical protein